ncbi:hypothetical protein [Aquibium sp. ELW1220]|uniref:hypothetical protein n=1 Tax=Aquibium sp. ELW1220 TaxID=2976766 RepID=UPI0025B15835|nr:hypothetical protein [Aquibium sp. ELW1220]MDN2583035.1 hypothetical protein [Aquibium sp. ELW1220]
MRITSTLNAAVMAAGMTFAAGAAFAQDQVCKCVVSATANIIGKVESVEGNVRISQAAGFSPVQDETALQKGATIIVGANSSTRLLLGNDCRVELGANQSMTLVAQDSGNICAAVRNEAPPTGNTTAAAVGALAGTALLVGGVIVFSQDDDKISVSQQ